MPTPTFEREVMDTFGREKYPAEYRADQGLLIFNKETQRLRPDSIDAIPPKDDPYTRFFLEANPHYLQGDELVCVACVHPDNFTPQLRRLLGMPRK